jgi:hypothetical protein
VSINFVKVPNTTFHENSSGRSRTVPFGQTDGRTDRQADTTNLVVTFRSHFANAPKSLKNVAFHCSRSTWEFMTRNIKYTTGGTTLCCHLLYYVRNRNIGSSQGFTATSCAPHWYYLSKDSASIEVWFTDCVCRSGDKKTHAGERKFLTWHWIFCPRLNLDMNYFSRVLLTDIN